MNKRDKFALAAMQAIISKNASKNLQTKQECAENSIGVARGAYFYADAMLEVSGWNSEYLATEPSSGVISVAHTDDSGQREPQASQEGHPCQQGCEACSGCNASDNQEAFEQFQPIQYTLETQEEVDLLKSLVGACHLNIDKEFGTNSFDMYQRIKNLSSKEGCLTINLETN